MKASKSLIGRMASVNRMAPAAALLALASLSACGKQNFKTIESVQTQTPPGYYSVAPKVDLLLVHDNSGSMMEVYQQARVQIPSLLQSLETSGWDYHFAAIPLIPTSISQSSGTSDPWSSPLFSKVTASRQDPNWGSTDWKTPYPGALFSLSLSGAVAPTAFLKPDTFAGTVSILAENQGGLEPGLETIRRTLKSSAMQSTGFLRPDSLLVVVLLSNGNDTSYVHYCPKIDGSGTVPCDSSVANLNGTRTCGTPGITDITLCRPKNDDGSVWVSGTLDPTKNTRAYTMNYYVSQLQAVRPNMRVYAATADGSTCMGYPSFDGSRYKTLTSAIGGWNYNICGASSTSTAMAQVFTNLRSELQVRIQAFRTKLIMVEQQPDLSTVKIVKYPSGNRNAPITLNQISSSSAQTSVNGWTYIGRIENRATMETSELPPAPMNYASGYAIELKGSAVLEGSDTLEISYKPSYSASAAAAK